MAINRIDFPASTPVAVADYQAQNTLIHAAFSESGDVFPWAGTAMSIGFVFQVGGTVYKVDTATTISGTASSYVKITPSGATASASFVASLAGVSWSTVYNGYYDGSGNRYFFDEALATVNGAVTTPKTLLGKVTSLPANSLGVGAVAILDGGSVGKNSSSYTGGGAVGNTASSFTGGAVGKLATTSSGGAVGENSSSGFGGAVGAGANTTSGGASGVGATSTSGAAMGYNAVTVDGASIGNDTVSTSGGAVGSNAEATNGFSGGSGAISGDNQASFFNKMKYGYFASTATQNTVYDFLSPLLITNGRLITAIGVHGADRINAVQRSSATALFISTSGAGITVNDGSGSTIGADISILVVQGT